MKAVHHKARRLVSIVESMAEARLSIALAALISLAVCLPGANAQTTIDPRGATHFPGNAYATRSTVDDGSPTSTHGLSCSYWYVSTVPHTATIFQVLPFPQNTFSVELQHILYNGKMVFSITLADVTNTNVMIAEEIDPLPYDGKPHGVVFAVDTGLGFSAVSLDGKTLRGGLDSIFDGPFAFLWNHSTWSVGAALTGPNLMSTNFFTGDIGRLYCIAAGNIFDINVNPLNHVSSGELRSATIGQVILTVGHSSITHLGPLPLSTPTDPDCSAPYHPVLVGKPTVCMQGGMPDFLTNINNNPFSAVGTLTTAPASSNPWGMWPSTYP